MASDNNRVKLEYKKTCQIKNEDAKRFITLASKKLADIFIDETNNKLMLKIFTSKEIFRGRESEKVRKNADNSLEFTDGFCSLLQNRDDVPRALDQLLNLEDTELDNYETQIRKAFVSIIPEELKIVDDGEVQTENSNNGQTDPPPTLQLGIVIPRAIDQQQSTANEEVDGQGRLDPDVQQIQKSTKHR